MDSNYLKKIILSIVLGGLLCSLLINRYLNAPIVLSSNFATENVQSIKPKISIITSVYNSDKFIEHFMDNITQQTIFDDCELILINANSPGKIETSVIAKYQKKYSNIIYIQLAKDPGLYAVWNLGIKQARGQYITNANTDDYLADDCYEKHAQCLDKHSNIALVYSDFYLSYQPNVTFKSVNQFRKFYRPEFSRAEIKRNCLPSFNPMWRKSVHDQCGYFDETFKVAGDYEMWIRMVNHGLKFKKVAGINGIYYNNPNGLSSSSKYQQKLNLELEKIYMRYRLFFKTSE